MKRFLQTVGAICWTAYMSASASAALVTVEANGQVSNIQADDPSGPLPPPPMSIALGDQFSLSMDFHVGLARSDPYFSSNPTIGIYAVPGTVKVSIGGIAQTFPAGWTQGTVELYDNFYAEGDAQLFEFTGDGASQLSIPVEMGNGYLSQGILFRVYDSSADARNNDLISDLKPLSLFPDKHFVMLFVNNDTNFFVTIEGSVANSSISVREAPEPASWAMMIIGLGAVGGARRRARRARLLAASTDSRACAGKDEAATDECGVTA